MRSAAAPIAGASTGWSSSNPSCRVSTAAPIRPLPRNTNARRGPASTGSSTSASRPSSRISGAPTRARRYPLAWQRGARCTDVRGEDVLVERRAGARAERGGEPRRLAGARDPHRRGCEPARPARRGARPHRSPHRARLDDRAPGSPGARAPPRPAPSRPSRSALVERLAGRRAARRRVRARRRAPARPPARSASELEQPHRQRLDDERDPRAGLARRRRGGGSRGRSRSGTGRSGRAAARCGGARARRAARPARRPRARRARRVARRAGSRSSTPTTRGGGAAAPRAPARREREREREDAATPTPRRRARGAASAASPSVHSQRSFRSTPWSPVATSGLSLSHWYCTAVCSPSRSSACALLAARARERRLEAEPQPVAQEPRLELGARLHLARSPRSRRS